MGHTVYYKTSIGRWEAFGAFLRRVCTGLGYGFEASGDSIVITPDCRLVEPLWIEKRGEGFVKTNRIEPCHSIYLLILHSVSAFGSVELWED
ncbi:TonB-dependent receptor [Thermococcus sp. Bubb.Bath]|nr:TonB-dependent receptor [Thermococcus sp. Bubb.Bath]